MKQKIIEWLHLDDLAATGRKYIDAKVELVKLEIHQLLTKVVALLVVGFIIMFLSFLALAFLSISVGNLLNDVFNSNYLGYLVMTGFFLLVIAVIIFKLKQIKNKIISICSDIISEFINNSTSTSTDKIS